MRKILQKYWTLVPILLSLAFITLLLIIFGANPMEALTALIQGAFGSQSRILSVLAFWIPMLLASTGLLLTFKAGLWNIGVEGQIVMGAIGASWIALNVEAPTFILITLELIVAMSAGALWAGLSAILKTKGKVHEIFSGLALTNLAIILTNYLISSPWQPAEGGTFRGTAPFQEVALLPRLLDSRFSPISLI
ncbi:MAG: ABC transporter permease, partial [Chloroflexota bacterium]